MQWEKGTRGNNWPIATGRLFRADRRQRGIADMAGPAATHGNRRTAPSKRACIGPRSTQLFLFSRATGSHPDCRAIAARGSNPLGRANQYNQLLRRIVGDSGDSHWRQFFRPILATSGLPTPLRRPSENHQHRMVQTWSSRSPLRCRFNALAVFRCARAPMVIPDRFQMKIQCARDFPAREGVRRPSPSRRARRSAKLTPSSAFGHRRRQIQQKENPAARLFVRP
jgi:hypothetical protein